MLFTDAKSQKLIGMKSTGSQEAPMNSHKNSRTTVDTREILIYRKQYTRTCVQLMSQGPNVPSKDGPGATGPRNRRT